MSEEVDLDYVGNLENDQNVLLIDVRELSQIEKTGKIPWSIHIPLANLEETLKESSDEDFQSKYNKEKSNLDSPIVFYCQIGRKSLIALETLKKLGYQNVKHYPGGFAEWEAKKNRGSLWKVVKDSVK